MDLARRNGRTGAGYPGMPGQPHRYGQLPVRGRWHRADKTRFVRRDIELGRVSLEHRLTTGHL